VIKELMLKMKKAPGSSVQHMIHAMLEKEARTYEGPKALSDWYADVSRHWNEIKRALEIAKTLGAKYPEADSKGNKRSRDSESIASLDTTDRRGGRGRGHAQRGGRGRGDGRGG
jgi:hypothetical protein